MCMYKLNFKTGLKEIRYEVIDYSVLIHGA